MLTRWWTLAKLSTSNSLLTWIEPGTQLLPRSLRKQVHDHHVLGAVLRARAQLVGERAIARAIRGARPRAFDRLRLDAVAGHAQEQLGRGAQTTLPSGKSR